MGGLPVTYVHLKPKGYVDGLKACIHTIYEFSYACCK